MGYEVILANGAVIECRGVSSLSQGMLSVWIDESQYAPYGLGGFKTTEPSLVLSSAAWLAYRRLHDA